MAQTNADVKIFAGDCNFLPLNGKDQPYTLLTSYMTDAMLNKYRGQSDNPWFATFGNRYNTYTKPSDIPERIDYLMYRVDSPNIVLKCINFTMPMHTTKNKKGKVVSLSDHEFLLADFLIEKLPPKPDDVQEDVDVTAIEPRPEINKQLAGSKQTVHFDDDEAAAVSQLRIKSHKDIFHRYITSPHDHSGPENLKKSRPKKKTCQMILPNQFHRTLTFMENILYW